MIICYVVLKGVFVGGGDVKLICAISLLIGWEATMLALLLAGVVALIIHLPSVRYFKKKSMFAFGPYLSAGILVSILICNCQKFGIFYK